MNINIGLFSPSPSTLSYRQIKFNNFSKLSILHPRIFMFIWLFTEGKFKINLLPIFTLDATTEFTEFFMLSLELSHVIYYPVMHPEIKVLKPTSGVERCKAFEALLKFMTTTIVEEKLLLHGQVITCLCEFIKALSTGKVNSHVSLQ